MNIWSGSAGVYDYTPMKKCHALQPREYARHNIEAALLNDSSHTLAAHWQGMLKRCFDHARGADNTSEALTAHIMPPKPPASTARQKLWIGRPLQALATFQSLLYFAKQH